MTSAKPITLVIPVEHAEYYETIALRIAHNLYTYLRLDCNILRDSEVDGSLEGQSVVVIGGHHNKYGMAIRSSPLQVSLDGLILIAGEKYSGAGIGSLSIYKVSKEGKHIETQFSEERKDSRDVMVGVHRRKAVIREHEPHV